MAGLLKQILGENPFAGFAVRGIYDGCKEEFIKSLKYLVFFIEKDFFTEDLKTLNSIKSSRVRRSAARQSLLNALGLMAFICTVGGAGGTPARWKEQYIACAKNNEQ